MAKKITGLTEATSIDDTDYYVIVDVSDTSMAASGTTKKILKSNVGGGLPAGTVVMEEIARDTDPVAGEFDFDSIPQNYDRLIVKGYVRSSVSTVNDGMQAYYNGDLTASNYHRQYHSAANGATLSDGEAPVPDVAQISGGTAVAGGYGDVELTIEGYAVAGKIKLARSWVGSQRDADNLQVGETTMSWDASTAAITRIQFRADQHPTDTLTGTLILYGERTL